MTESGSAAKLQAIFELSPAILSITSLDDGRLLEVNDAFLRTTGYTREEILGRPVRELSFWADPRQRDEGLATLRAGRSIRDLEARFRAKDGREIVAIVAGAIVTIDGRACVLTALTDITDRVRAETALRESERRFAQAFDANPLPMVITSLRDGRHLDVNAAAVRHTGYAREEMLGRTREELGFAVAPEQEDRLQKLLHSKGRAHDFEVVFRPRSGAQRHLLVNSEVITYGGEPAVLSVALDITDRTQLEAQREARRLEAEAVAQAKDQFLAMLGHELRNPLGAITNALAVLERGLADEQLPRVIGIIGRQTAQLARLVDDLLDVARLSSGKVELRPETLDLREVARRCVEALRDGGRAAQHDLAVEGEAVRVTGDPARLEQVVVNLLDNALKYTPPGGCIRVLTERAGEDAILRVRDTGEGIAPDVLPRIFELFVQGPQALDRSRGGLGLGLTLVKQLVELHGGSVSVTSPGRGLGSEFTIRLPAASTARRQRPAAVAAPPSTDHRRRRVLIVEDSADAREVMRLLLQFAGHDVDTSPDAQGGLDRLPTFRPDVALIDVGLPGIDGYALAGLIRQSPQGRDVLLIAVTGYGQPEDRRKALAAGFDVHLTKPVDPTHLEAILTRHSS